MIFFFLYIPRVHNRSIWPDALHTSYAPSRGHLRSPKIFSQNLPWIFMRPDIFVTISCHELHDIFFSAVVYFSAFARHIRKVEVIFSMKIHHPEVLPTFVLQNDSILWNLVKSSRRFILINKTKAIVEAKYEEYYANVSLKVK